MIARYPTFTGFTDFLRLYRDTMTARPEFPKLILKVLALNQGPGADSSSSCGKADEHGELARCRT